MSIMKQINTYINEKLHLTTKHQYTCQPKDKKELQRIIRQRIKDEGYECDLNDIDTSKITDMYQLFDAGPSDLGGNPAFKKFNCDISMWDVSNVKDMQFMFRMCEKFNCDLSRWNVSNVKYMNDMFYGCKHFNCDISNWNVLNVYDMTGMFKDCENFNQDLNRWDVSNVEYMHKTFKYCPTKPTWYDKNKWEWQ